MANLSPFVYDFKVWGWYVYFQRFQFIDVEEMVRCISRVSSAIEPSTLSSSSSLSVPVIPHNTPDAAISALNAMVEDPVFKLLVSVHNTIQRVQCFQCPPPALCSDARDLVQEVTFLFSRLKSPFQLAVHGCSSAKSSSWICRDFRHSQQNWIWVPFLFPW